MGVRELKIFKTAMLKAVVGVLTNNRSYQQLTFSNM
jgi:hypothetical protein